jgi:MYXO-CTERM domain-containing protein
MNRFKSAILLAFLGFAFGLGQAARATDGTATDVSGLAYTGTTTNGVLLTGGSVDQNWSVTEAFVGGTSYSGTSQYTGAAYVVNNSAIESASYVQDTTSAQWITAPGASTSSGGTSTNSGGLYLPGNGTAAPNVAEYVYTLSFQVEGTLGSGGSKHVVGNELQISLTIAADDDYAIYVNPTLSGGMPTGTASATGVNSWTNSTTDYLQNYNGTTTGSSSQSANAGFVIGTNTLTIVVTNSNEITGSSSSTVLNPSGLLVYEVGSEAVIDGNPVPEVGAWLPILGAVGLVGAVAWRRRRHRPIPVNSAGP